MPDKKKGAVITEDWLNQLEPLDPIDFKVVMVKILRYRLFKEEDLTGLTPAQKTISMMLIGEAKRMDNHSENSKKSQNKKSQSDVKLTSSCNQFDVTEGEGEGEGETQHNNPSDYHVCVYGAHPILTTDQVNLLTDKGVPLAYIDHFESQVVAKDYSYKNPVAACMNWWNKDKSKEEWRPSNKLFSSFDEDDVFNAGVERSMNGY